MKLTILHLTDLHVKDRITYFEKKIDSISRIINNDHVTDNFLVLFSGDLSFSGEKEQFAHLKELIDELNRRIKKQVYYSVCPGNHDRIFPTGMIMGNDVVTKINEDNYLEKINEHSSMNCEYNSFIESLENKGKIEIINSILNKYTINFSGDKVVIYSLNNALLSYFNPNEKGETRSHLLIPKDLIDINRTNEKLCILLMHMPLDSLTMNTRNAIKCVCEKHIDLIVDGHTHEEEISIKDNDIIEITSSALHAGEASGFSVIHIIDNEMTLSMYQFDTETRRYVKKEPDITKTMEIKQASFDGLLCNKELIEDINKPKEINGYTIRPNELFVFPKLIEKRYINTSKQFSISNFDDFCVSIKSKRIISITGDETSGKSTLAQNLFLSFIDKNCCPILCNGYDFGKKVKDIEKCINSLIKSNYDGIDIVNRYYELEKTKKILIVDDAVSLTDDLLLELSNYFEKIIIIYNNEFEHSFTLDKDANLPSLHLVMMPFYKDKREQLYRKIYEAIVYRKPEIGSNINIDEFTRKLDDYVDRVEHKYLIDIATLISLCVNALTDINIINGSDTSFVANRFQYLIDNYLKRRNIKNISCITIERILGKIAYSLYEHKQTLFDLIFIDVEKNEYANEYDRNLLSYSTESLVKILVDLKIIKKYKEKYIFGSRNIFAHYIGFYAMHKFENDESQECLRTIISNGVYSPLNFTILMDIAISRNNERIINTFVDSLSKDVSFYEFKNNNVDSISLYFDKEKKRIAKIDEKEIQIRRENIAKYEEKQREEYVINLDNYFYEKSTSAEMKELIEFSNKSRILATLMDHGDMLKESKKDQLCTLNLIYPNIVIDKYILLVKVLFDDLYLKILDNADETNADGKFETTLNSFFDFLLSFVTATFLGIYDSSSRPIHSETMTKRLLRLAKDRGNFEKSFMPDIQRLMIVSFSRDYNNVLNSIKDYVDKCDNPYLKNCALLIGRRVAMDNYETFRQNNRPFLEYIKNSFDKNFIADSTKKR